MCKLNFVLAVILFLAMVCLAQQAVQTQSSASHTLSAVEVDQLKAKAQSGDAAAQLNLGKAYEEGNSVPQSDEQAVKWYRAAAERGNASAENDLGLMFMLGNGVEKDKVEAVRWYKKAAKQENPNAMFNLGAAYYNADGGTSNLLTAYAWFLLAANFHSQSGIDAVKHMKEEAGSLESAALEEVGDMYKKGDDLPKNPDEAINWYHRAAGSGPAGVQMKLADLLFHAPNAAANYGEIHNLCERAAALNSPQGSYCLGSCTLTDGE